MKFNKIKQYMLDDLNERLEKLGCSFCLKFKQYYDGTLSNTCETVLKNDIFKDDKFVNRCIIEFTPEFSKYLSDFFAEYDVEIIINGNRTEIMAYSL